MTSPLATIILAAGKGTRMRSNLPKVLHKVAGRPMIGHVVAALDPLGPARGVLVLSPGQEAVAATAPHLSVAIQDPPQGTGHAVATALPALADLAGDTRVLIVYGDTPLVETATLGALAAALDDGDLGVLGFRPPDPGPYGRLVLDGSGGLARIVEAREATEAERAIGLCNAGLMAARLDLLRALLPRLSNANAKGEYYLTDLVALARAAGARVSVAETDADAVAGVNSRADLAAVEAILQRRLRARALDAGVTMIDPESVFLSADTRLGRDVVIEPQVVFGPGVVVGDDVVIRAFSHVEGAVIGPGAIVGPFARLRPGADVGPGAHVGNFVEVKNARLGPGVKANHLTYLGDADIGADTNIGAGTITCNYDGFDKHRTTIGARAFIGSNTALVAPILIGDDAYVGSGSVVTKPVSPGALAVERADQREVPGWVARFRARKARARDKE